MGETNSCRKVLYVDSLISQGDGTQVNDKKVKDSYHTIEVLPESLRNSALRKLHDSRIAGHHGRARTIQRVKERYYWIGLATYVNNYCSICDGCQKKQPLKLSEHGPMKCYNVGAPIRRESLSTF